METFIGTFLILICAGLFLGIRVLLVRNGQFRGTCSTSNPNIENHGIHCGCKKKEHSICESSDSTGLTSISRLSDPNRDKPLYNVNLK